MARLRHNPTRPDSGFNPIRLDRSEIARMREETDRIIRNMDRNRIAEYEQGKANLQALRDNEEYTRRAEQRNFDVQQQNMKAELLQNQLDVQTSQRQADVTSQASQQIFGSLAGFSKTAADLTAKREVEQEKRDIQAGYIAAVVDPDYAKQVEFKNLESQVLQQSELFEGILKTQEAEGADPEAIATARFGNPALTHFSNKGQASVIISNQVPIVAEALMGSDLTIDYKGQKVSLANARRDPELMDRVNLLALRTVLQRNNLVGLEDQFLLPGLQEFEKYRQIQHASAKKFKIEDTYAQRNDLIESTLYNNPDGLARYGPTAFRQWAADPNLGYSGALDKYEKLATTRDQNGNLRYSMEELAALDLKGNGRTFAEEWPGRFADMQEARVKSQLEYDKRQLQMDDLTFTKDSERILEGLTQDPTQSNADAAVEFFRNTYGKVPADILRFQASYTVEAVQKAEGIKKLEAIPDGLITREAVAAAQALDPTAGRVLAERYKAQEARYNQGIYKETAESFKATANGVTSFGTNKPNTPSSVFLQERMKAEYRARVDRAVAGGMDFNQAATTIGQALDAEVKAGARDPNSPWFRKPDAPGGSATFPNLNKGALSAVEQANRRFSELQKNIRQNGLERVISTKNSIITAEEAPVIARNYGKPGFTIPQDVLAVAGMSNGLDPMVIINRQFAALGLPALQPPPSLQTTGQTVSPSFQRLLYKTPSADRSARGLGSANTFNPTIVPNNLGMVYQQAGQAVGVNPAFLAALGEIESTHGADRVSYNGSSFGVMQINRAAHPNFFAQNDWKNPQANITYGAQYFKQMLDRYKDPVAAAMAYNAGPGNYDAYVRGEMPDGPKKTEMLNHGKKFTKALYKYGGSTASLNNPHLMRTSNSNMRLTSSALNYVGMDTSDGPDAGRNACVWALNKVMRAAGMDVPWGNSLYVPEVKRVLDERGRRVSGPMPGAIAIMQDNHPTDPYPHIGIVGADGMIISNSTSRARFDWKDTPQAYEQAYGRPNLYYMLN